MRTSLSASKSPDLPAAANSARKRFREIYREEISQTLSDPADLAGELRHLAAALAGENAPAV